MNILENYLDNVLAPQLTAFGVPAAAISKVTDNIKTQIYSLLQIWNDTTLKNTILLIGLEEGKFYDSNASDAVKSFVVVTIRNSMFETLASVGYKTLGLERMISDSEVKEVTSKAVDYFSQTSLNELSLKLDYSDTNNLYLRIKEKYPVAWNAMEIIANAEKCNIHFPKVKGVPEAEMLEEISAIEAEGGIESEEGAIVHLDGYSAELDRSLLGAMKNALTRNEYIFIVSCFKMISRNIEKLFRILDFVLCCNRMCVTANYLIANGHVERRNPILPASHGETDAYQKLKNLEGLQTKHSRILKSVNI